MINIYQEYPPPWTKYYLFGNWNVFFFFRLSMSMLLITMKSCFLSLTTHVLLGIWIFKMVERLLKIRYYKSDITKVCLLNLTKNEAKQQSALGKHPLSSWPLVSQMENSSFFSLLLPLHSHLPFFFRTFLYPAVIL